MSQKVENAVLKLDSFNQCTVSTGDKFRLNRVHADEGAHVEFQVNGTFENPSAKGTAVCKVIKHIKDKGCIVFKKIRRHGYARLRGHRRSFTILSVEEIRMGV